MPLDRTVLDAALADADTSLAAALAAIDRAQAEDSAVCVPAPEEPEPVNPPAEPFSVSFAGSSVTPTVVGPVRATDLAKSAALVRFTPDAAGATTPSISFGPGAISVTRPSTADIIATGQYISTVVDVYDRVEVQGLTIEVAKSGSSNPRSVVVQLVSGDVSKVALAELVPSQAPTYSTYTVDPDFLARDTVEVRVFPQVTQPDQNLRVRALRLSGAVDRVPVQPEQPEEPTLTNVVARTDTARRVTISMDPVAGATEYVTRSNGAVKARTTVPTRTSPILPADSYHTYTMSAVVNGAEIESDEIVVHVDGTARTFRAGDITVPPPVEPTPPTEPPVTPPPTSDLDAAWQAAYDETVRTLRAAPLENFFKNAKFGPNRQQNLSSLPVYDGPSTITSQADADRVNGRRITKNLVIRGPQGDGQRIVLRNFYAEKARIDQVIGHVAYYDFLVDAKSGADFPNYFRIGGNTSGVCTAILERGEIRNNQDGLQTWPGRGEAQDEFKNWIRAKYLYIHTPSENFGNLSGVNTHQDGLQHMAGSLYVTRCHWNYSSGRNANVWIKLDHGDGGDLEFTYSLLGKRGDHAFSLWDNSGDGPRDWTGSLDLTGNIVYLQDPGDGTFDMWQLDEPFRSRARNFTALALPSGKRVVYRHQAPFPS